MTDTALAAAHPHAAEPQLAPLDQIDVAPENLRAAEPADADIPELANTVEAAGLLYPLLVRPGRKGEAAFMALDGRRRLLALRSLVDEGRASADYLVKIEVARDKALQAAAIVVSNTQRAPVHVADVIIAIGKLKSLKLTPGKIAAALGYPEIEIKRLQRLAGLPKPALDALKAGRMTLRAAKLLARIADPDVAKTFAQNAAAGCLSEYAISRHLDARPGLDDPMFDLIGIERYRAAGGRIDADLFGEFDDVVLDPDKLQTLWIDRVNGLVEAARARGLAVTLQAGEVYRAPEGLETGHAQAVATLNEDQRLAWDLASARVDDQAQALSQGDRSAETRDDELVAFLIARLEQEAALHGSGRLAAVGLYPELGTGFDVQAFLRPREVEPDLESAEDGEGEPGDPAEHPAGPGYRPEVVVPPHEVDTEGRGHSLHETYTDIATRGLIRTVADDPMVALTITVARMFVILALQGGASTEMSASTIQGRRYSRGSLPANPVLDGVVRDRLDAKRRAYLASGLRPIPWVDALAHGEKMELLAELIAISLDLREPGAPWVRRAARAEAAEIVDLTGHDIAAYWTPDAAFLAQHTKGQLMAALQAMGADIGPTKGLKKEELVGYVASVAAEQAWAPAALNLRIEAPFAGEDEEDESVSSDTLPASSAEPEPEVCEAA